MAVGPAESRVAVGQLPVGASDVAAAAIGRDVYVVGGYTGTAPLSTIVAWSGSGAGRVVARLPHPLPYAAVAAVAGRLIVAGGTSGTTATSYVYEFYPSSGRLLRIGALPRPLTHAAAATWDRRSASLTLVRITPVEWLPPRCEWFHHSRSIIVACHRD